MRSHFILSNVADRADATLAFLVAEETTPANDLGNLRWHHLVPGFVSGGDALEYVP